MENHINKLLQSLWIHSDGQCVVKSLEAWEDAVPDVPSVNVGVSLPGEQLAIEIIRLITVMIVGQPPEVRKQMWEWYVEDMKAWRTLWGLNK